MRINIKITSLLTTSIVAALACGKGKSGGQGDSQSSEPAETTKVMPDPAVPAEEKSTTITKVPGCYVQSSNQYLGVPLSDCGLILFSNGITASFDALGNPGSVGGAYGSYTFSNGAGNVTTPTTVSTQCGFTSSDCSGTCYATLYVSVGSSPGGSAYSISGLIKNKGYYTGSDWVHSTGLEKNAGSMTLASYVDALGCHALSWTARDTFPVTTSWTPPVTLNLPLGPIYVGFSE